MSFYILLYISIISFIFFIGYKSFKKYKTKLHGKYFFFSCIFLSIWLIVYLLSFTTTYDKEILLFYSRFLYGIALLSMYTMLFFIYFFGEKNKKIINKIVIIVLASGFLISLFSPYIIENMIYDEIKKIHYEKYGILYNIYALLYLLFIPLFILTSYFKVKKLSTINKIRIKYISIGFIIFMSLEIIFLSILPIFGIRVLEKEQVLFFIPFILGAFYSIHKYHFSNIKIGIGKIFISLLSLFWSIIFINLFKNYFFSIDNRLINFWGLSNNFGIVDLSLGIVLYIYIYKFLSKVFLKETKEYLFSKKLDSLKSKIPFITNLNDLNNYLSIEFKELFNIKYININIYKNNKLLELKKYFSKNIINNLLINDIVFLEENKNKFNLEKIKNELNKKSYLIFPLKNNKSNLIGHFSIGAKPFKDNYYSEEIESFQDFISFLEGHLKYISIYSKIEELSINLDKKVDEKTIEYNTLINKQKDFIRMLSHEVKSPIASTIFQSDCLLDDIKNGKYDQAFLEKELSILNKQLIKSGDLLNNLFSVEQYDINKFKLFKEKIDLNNFIYEEIEIFKSSYPKIKFKVNILKTLPEIEIEIDKIQFKQVINNLINNAIKFCNKIEPLISIEIKQTKNIISISIEDNGEGFKNIDIETIFKKYSTGNNSSIGIGMGLYLCKKIVELHGGKISANKSKKIGGAKFIIEIPTK